MCWAIADIKAVRMCGLSIFLMSASVSFSKSRLLSALSSSFVIVHPSVSIAELNTTVLTYTVLIEPRNRHAELIGADTPGRSKTSFDQSLKPDIVATRCSIQAQDQPALSGNQLKQLEKEPPFDTRSNRDIVPRGPVYEVERRGERDSRGGPEEPSSTCRGISNLRG